MLLQFAIENYRSIADRVVLSFLAIDGEVHPEGQTVEVPGIGRVLRSLVLYGPNASGKSNIVRAFQTLCEVASAGVDAGERLPADPHRLRSGWTERPCRFEVELSLGGLQYAYGIAFTGDNVVAEWLHRVHGDRDEAIFERDAARGITLGLGLKVTARRRKFYEFVAEGTRPEQPFLAELRDRNATEFDPIFEYFSDSFTHHADEEWGERGLTYALLTGNSERVELRDFLIAAGIPVSDLRLASGNRDLQDRIDRGEDFEHEEAKALVFDALIRQIQPEFVVRGSAGQPVAFDYDDLSDGTRRLMWLSPHGPGGDIASTVFVDELDRSLHTQLTRFLVQQWNATEGAGQCVFTTHDTNLLDARVFGRDAIWFVEMDPTGATQLYTLAEFDRDQLDALTGRIEEGYLQGRFGAVPFAGDPVRLGWNGR